MTTIGTKSISNTPIITLCIEIDRTDHRQARRLQTHSIGSETTEFIWMKFGKYTHSLSSGR